MGKGRPHRELVYDPSFSTRKFKRFHRLSTNGAAMQVARDMGLACGHDGPQSMPKRWRTNPYPPGRRHDMFEESIKDGQRERDEERTYRRWNR